MNIRKFINKMENKERGYAGTRGCGDAGTRGNGEMGTGDKIVLRKVTEK